jgi:hypothetical protein
VRVSSAYALWRMLTAFPSSATFGHPVSSVRPLPRGDTRCSVTDRPRPPFRRHPAKSAAFQSARMPFTATDTKDVTRRDGSLRPSLRRSRSRGPHAFPGLGTVLFCWALQAHGSGHPLFRDSRECRRLCCSLELPRLGLTTQARHRGRPTRPSTRAVRLARTDAGRSA